MVSQKEKPRLPVVVTQLEIGFTLMLTVVAFNFYSASILPKLPYQTFIETAIIVGYVFIFPRIVQ